LLGGCRPQVGAKVSVQLQTTRALWNATCYCTRYTYVWRSAAVRAISCTDSRRDTTPTPRQSMDVASPWISDNDEESY